MQQILPYDPFPFLTLSRIHALKSGIMSFNLDYQSIIEDRWHLYQHMSAWHRAFAMRPLVLAHILEALSDEDGVENCEFHNMQGILYDRAHFCRLFKLHEPIDKASVGGPRIGREPIIVWRARVLPSPRLLFPQEALDDGFIPPLSRLCVYDIGYYVRRSEVVELYFLHQDGVQLYAMKQLGMFSDDYPQAGIESA